MVQPRVARWDYFSQAFALNFSDGREQKVLWFLKSGIFCTVNTILLSSQFANQSLRTDLNFCPNERKPL